MTQSHDHGPREFYSLRGIDLDSSSVGLVNTIVTARRDPSGFEIVERQTNGRKRKRQAVGEAAMSGARSTAESAAEPAAATIGRPYNELEGSFSQDSADGVVM